MLAAVLASEDGDAIARLAEGYYYGRGREKNLRTALQLWERAAALGNAEAQYYRGVPSALMYICNASDSV